MANDKILKFQVAIQDNATEELDKIEKQLNGIVEKFRTSVGSVNAELGKIGKGFQLPNMAEALKQTEQLKETLKKGTGDIPLFKNVLEQMQQLQGFVGKNTLGAELDRMKKSLNGVFAEIPNVNASSFSAYFNQLSKAYSDFMAKLGNQRAMSPNLVSIGESIQKMGAFSGGDTLLRDYQAQAEQIRSTIINTIRETNTVIAETKRLIGSGGSLDFSKINANINATAESLNKLSEAFTKFNGTIGGDKNLQNMMAGMGEIIRNVKLAMGSLEQGQKDLNWGKTMRDNAKSVLQASAELEKLVPLMEKLKTQRFMSKNLGLDTSNIDKAIQRVQHLQQLLASITVSGGLSVSKLENLNGLNTTQLMSMFREHLVSARNDLATQSQANTQALKNEAQAQKENELAKKQSAQASGHLAQEESRLAQSIQHVTNSARGQSQVVSDLKSMAMQYLSLWGAQSLVTNMAQITGELQLQAKSLEVILNNASAAKQMYGEIRDLSQMSPYTFEDLLKSHRQLAAFGIEPKDMFSTMKSLADIGAGLDVDISRLILAFGHTRSYGYLSGIQNRQFENAGIDMIGGLAAKYNELADAEKRAGREAQYVTRADIFKRMRARSIPFEDVQDVVLDLDRPGGKFYNMQIRQFETLGGKLRNLRNNYRIMMSEIGNSNQELLMGGVNIINDLTEHWEKYARVIKGVAFAYGTLKLAGLASSKAVAAANKQIMASSLASNQQIMTSAYLNTTGPWYRRMFFAAANKIEKAPQVPSNNDFQNLRNNKEINNITKQRIALTAKLTEAQRAELLTATGVNQARAAQIAGFSAWRRGLMSVRLGMIAVAQSAKAMAVAILTNPATWIFAAIAGITALADKLGQTAEQAESLKKTIKDAAQTDIQGLNQLLDPFENNGILKTTGESSISGGGYTATRKLIDVDAIELEAHGVEGVFDELKRALQVQSPFYEGDYFDIMKAKDQAGQVEEAFRKLENFRYVKQVEQMTADRMESGLKETGAGYTPFTWGRGESLGTNMKDYAEAQAAYTNGMRITETMWNAFAAEDKRAIDNYVKELGVSRDEALGKYLLNNEDARERLKVSLSMKNFEQLGAVMTHLETAKSDMKPTAKAFASIFKDAFSGNADGAMTYFEDTMNKMFAEAKIGSPEAQAELSSNMAIFIRDAMNEAGNKAGGEEFLIKYIERHVGVMANRLINKDVNINTKEEDVKKIAEKSTMSAIEAIKKSDPKIAKELSKLGDSAMKALIERINKSNEGVANSLRKILSWQGRAKRFGIAVQPTIDVDYTEFISEQRKLIKEAEDKLKVNDRRIKTILKVDVLPDFNFKNVEEVKAFLKLIGGQRKRLSKDIENFTRAHRDKDGITRGENWDKLSNMRGELDSLKDYEKFAKVILQKGSYLDNEHQSWHDDSKKKDKKGSQEDKYAKGIRSQAQLLGEAYNEYRKWEEKIGDKGALKKVQELFFGKDSVLTKAGFSFRDVPNYYQNLVKLRDKLNSHYGTKKGHNNYVLDAIKELSKSINQVNFDNFTKSSEEWASRVSLQLERLTKKWELYNKVLTATGNKQLAASLSGFDTDKYQNVADALKDKISSDLKKAGVTSLYSFDINASDKQMEEGVKSMLGTGVDAEKIKAIVDELKKWQELQKQINNESVETYANLIGGLSRYMDNIRKANSEYDNIMRKLSDGLKGGVITQSQYDEGELLASAKRDRVTNEASYGYKNIMSLNTALPIGAAIANAKAALNLLDRQLKEGTISAEEYSKKVKDINTALNTLKDKKATSLFSTFLNGGPQAVADRKRDEAFDAYALAAQKAEVAISEREQAKKQLETHPDDLEAYKKHALSSIKAKQALENVKGAKEEYDARNGQAQKMKKFTDAMNKAVDAMGKLNQAANLLGGVFDSLGMKGAANAMGDMSTMLGGAINGASSLSFLGPGGMVAGGALGLLGGIAQAHDNRLERQIEKLREDVSRIEGYTQIISKAQERTLGYDNGDLIRGYQRQYAENTMKIKMFGMSFGFNKEGRSGKAMADYYKAAGGDGANGYQQQLNLLNKQREDYVSMYNKEDKKKKKSSSSLQEYKQKIAELDDQIRYFSEDLAKNLWGIDIKGWADQLSDALANAFENGENMAKAYGDTVRSILQSIASKMMQMEILEPMFEKLQKKLFGDDKSKGVFDPADVTGSAKNVSKVVADYFGKDGEGSKAITAAQEFMTAYEAGINNAGLSLRNSSNSTLSSGIQGTSEETSALLAGYINALRQDVSYIRILQTQFINEAWPDYIKQITGMATTLGRIDANVAAIRSVISENGALYEKVERLSDDLHSVIFGNQKLQIG